MTEEEMSKARKIFFTLCNALDKHSFYYEKIEEDLVVKCKVQGDDLPIDIIFEIDVDKQLIILLSRLPFVVSESNRVDFAVATSIVNNGIIDGSFDFNIKKGSMFFRMTSSFIDSDLDEDVFIYLLMCSCHTIDDYNDKFFMLAKNMITLEKFFDEE